MAASTPAPHNTPGESTGFGTGLLHRLVAHVLTGHDAVVQDPTGGGPILELLTGALRARKCRVLRVKATQNGRVSDILAQVTGILCDGVPDEKLLERSFELLCTPGADCSRIVLLVANAHLLSRKEFRYLHLAAKSGPLQFVLAAPTDPLGQLDGDLVLLYNRMAAFDPLVIEPGTALAVLIPSTPRPVPRSAVQPAHQNPPVSPPVAASGSPRMRRRATEYATMAAVASVAFVFGGLGLYLVTAAPTAAASGTTMVLAGTPPPYPVASNLGGPGSTNSGPPALGSPVPGSPVPGSPVPGAAAAVASTPIAARAGNAPFRPLRLPTAGATATALPRHAAPAATQGRHPQLASE